VRVKRRVRIIVQNPPVPRLGKLGRARVEQELAWYYQERAHLGVYQRLTGGVKVLESAGEA
jgi:hypothetical protein